MPTPHRTKMRLRVERLEGRRLLHAGELHVSPDVTGDGLVDNHDVDLVNAKRGSSGPLGDANFDRTVNNLDLDLVTQALGSRPHPDSAERQAEHLALLRLALPVEATAVVVKSGNWSDPAVWQKGRVPVNGDKVWVPVVYSLTVDGITANVKWARVDGTLAFATRANTRLNIDTLIGTAQSHLQIATEEPFTTKIMITDDGPINTQWDKFMMSRGIVWHGSSDIHGAAKTTWSTATPVEAGATQLTVADVTGWKVGDRLILGGSGVVGSRGRGQLTVQDDLATIARIDGNVVTLTAPLTYSHGAVEGQNPVVTNMTRNVVVESAATDPLRRGHVMFMHNPDQQLSFTEFNRMGRTNKAVLISDADGAGNGLENVRGRYSAHFHRTGTALQAAYVNGISITDSPGWGLVNHDSNVIAENCVSYNVFGAHFVTELGNERGSFTKNVAIRAAGSGEHISTNTAARRARKDFGHSGAGFWLEGGDVAVTRNVAIGMASAGFTVFNTKAPVVFRDNVSLQSTRSLIVWRNRTAVGKNRLLPPPGTVFSEFSGNLLQGTVGIAYSSYLEFRNNTVVAFDNRLGTVGFGMNQFANSYRFIDNRVTGFKVGMDLPTQGESLIQGGFYDNLSINLSVIPPYSNHYRRIDIADVRFGDSATWNVNLKVESTSYRLLPAYPTNPNEGTRRVPDWRPLFAAENSAIGSNSQIRLDGVPLFFEEQGADFEFGRRLTRFPSEIRYEPDGVTFATGASLNARGLIVGGVPLPAGRQYHLDKVRGVLVDASGTGNGSGEIQVLDGSADIADNTGSVSFGTTEMNQSLARTFEIRNTGQQALNLTLPISVPAGYTVVTPPSTTTLAPGQTTTFAVRLDAATAGTYSGQVSFGTNDSDENPFNFNVTGTVMAPQVVEIIDNGDAAGFSMSGVWTPAAGPGVGRNDNVHMAFGESALPTDIATWTFNLGSPGRYRVSATWFTNTGFPQLFATAARYEVSDPETGAVHGTALINQRQFPNDFSDDGSVWEDLGVFDIFGSTLRVRLFSTSDNQTYVVADAVRIERIGNPPAGSAVSSTSESVGAASSSGTSTGSSSESGDLKSEAHDAALAATDWEQDVDDVATTLAKESAGSSNLTPVGGVSVADGIDRDEPLEATLLDLVG